MGKGPNPQTWCSTFLSDKKSLLTATGWSFATAIFYIFLTGIKKQQNHITQLYIDILIFWGLTMVRWTKGMPFRTLILDVQNFGSVFLRSNFWYQRNLRCYWQSQMLHRKIRITLASEVFHKKYYALPKHLRFLRALWYSYWMSHMYFDTSKQRKRKW